jgi:hypothetical protein
VIALDWMGRRARGSERGGEVNGQLGVEVRAAAGVVLTDRRRAVIQNARSRRRPQLERRARVQIPTVVAVEVDLKPAAHMRLVVRMGVEGRAVDLHGAVVARWVRPSVARPRGSGDPGACSQYEKQKGYTSNVHEHVVPAHALQGKRATSTLGECAHFPTNDLPRSDDSRLRLEECAGSDEGTDLFLERDRVTRGHDSACIASHASADGAVRGELPPTMGN